MTFSPQRGAAPPSEPHSALPSPPLSPVSLSPSPESIYTTSTTRRATRVVDATRTRMERTRSGSTSLSLSGVVNHGGVKVQVAGAGAAASTPSPPPSVITLASAHAHVHAIPSGSGNGSGGGGGSGTITQASAGVKATRRQSSIAYFTPSSPSPCDTRPMSEMIPEAGDVGVVGKRESGTWGGAGSKRASMVMCTRVGSARESLCEVYGSRERGPLTLVEKHADLLHFIAQKERKCLELRDQLVIHEQELAELKRKWERIVNRGFGSPNDVHSHPVSNSTHLLNSGLGGVALDGLKEGVRMIASGINEVIQDLEPAEKERKSVPTTAETTKPGHAPRESDSSTSVSLSTGTGSISHFSTSSRSSIWETPSVDALAGGNEKGEKETVATAPSLSRAGSLNSRMHKRASASRALSKERAVPPSAFVSGLSPRPTSVEFGEFVSSPAVSVSVSDSSSKPPAKSAAAPMTPPDSSNGSSWMDNMGKKLEELHKGQTFSKSQKRASVLLAGVSHSIATALLPGPTATTPAPSLASPRVSSTPSKGMDWLDEEEEQTRHVGEVMKPVLATKTMTAKACTPSAVSSFDDDDWNW